MFQEKNQSSPLSNQQNFPPHQSFTGSSVMEVGSSKVPLMFVSSDFNNESICSYTMCSSCDPTQQLLYNHQQAQIYERPLHNGSEGLERTMLFEENSEEMSTCLVTNQPELAEPCYIQRNTADNFITYQDSTELTARVLPEITKLLNDIDIVVVGEAAALMHQLSKKEPSRHAIIGTQNVVASIVHVMANTNDPDIQRNISGALYHLSEERPGLVSIYSAGGVPYLVQLLASSVDAVLFYTIATLHNLLMHYIPSKMSICFAGGLEKMVELLSKDNVKFLTITVDCLYMLAYRHQDRKLIILASGGPAQLVRVMRSYTYEKLLLTCSKLLKVLSVCASNKPEIIRAGGMQVLTMLLNHDNLWLVQNVLWTIRNLSDVAANKQDNVDNLLYMLIDFLSKNDDNIVLCAAGILSNLTCNNAKNKAVVTKMHGTEALVHTLINAAAADREEITDAAVCALRHLTSRHTHAEMARKVFRTQNGTSALAAILRSPMTQQSLVKAVRGLIMNLAISKENHATLEDHGLLKYKFHSQKKM